METFRVLLVMSTKKVRKTRGCSFTPGFLQVKEIFPNWPIKFGPWLDQKHRV